MNINPLAQFIQTEKSQNQTTYKATTTASDAFANTLNSVISRDQAATIQASQQTADAEYRKKKDLIETGDKMTEETEDSESIYKTVRKIETRLIKLARLERKMLAGF